MRAVPVAELPALVGQPLPPSDWLTIDQDRIDRFAAVTEDHQFIHVDPERARATPVGTTIAHGFLVLSLLSRLMKDQVIIPEGLAMTFNYGSDKVRFLNPVKVDSRIRALTTMLSAEEKGRGRWLVRTEATIEIEGEPKPALVAEILTLHLLA